MKKRIAVLSIICVLLRPWSGRSAPFQDLNFDSANTNTIFDASGVGDYVGPTTDLMPGWSVNDGDQYVGFNMSIPSLGYDSVISRSFAGAYPVVGSYSFVMVPRFSLSISQSGDLPSDVRTIHFLSYGSPLQLQVNGSLIPLAYTPIPSQPGWNPAIQVYDAAGDISSFAGQTVELRFITIPALEFGHGLDEISFSTIPIPEPGTWLLLWLGVFAFISRRR